MALRDLTDPSAVLTAISEADRLGEAAFLHKYGFKPSTRYRIEHDGRTYVSKALLAAAHGVQFPDEGPLSYTDLSGGAQVIGKARELGFAVRRIDGGAADELGVALARFMGLFSEARQEKFSHANPTFEAITSCASLIKELLPVSLEGATVRPSVGQGNWAAVPWIAVLHPHETATTQRGIYPVLLFHEDMQSVEVTIAQGVTELNQALGRRAAMAELERRSNVLRAASSRSANSALMLTRTSTWDAPRSLATTSRQRSFTDASR